MVTRIKNNAGGLYATYLIKEVFSHPVEFNTAYEEQERMHWLKSHAGMIVDKIEKSFFPDIITVTVNESIAVVPKWCIEEVEV